MSQGAEKRAEKRDEKLVDLASRGPVHFMGVGGSGMVALAELVLRAGGSVTGCDVRDSPGIRRLTGLGARISRGHDPAHVEDATAVVVTAAVPGDHPELRRARERAIPVMKRARALGELVNRGTVVAVAGTHGKTSTTAMATGVLAAGELDPTGLVGGSVPSWEGNLRYGSGDLFVVEADEYDRSFLSLEPDVAVVTNLEADHLDTYGDLDGVREGFRDFLEKVRSGGRVVVCADDPGASALLAGNPAGYTYGLSAGSQLRAVDVNPTPDGTTCRVVEDGRERGAVTVRVPGLHNLRNGLAAAACARHLGVGWEAIGRGLADFAGVGRRFQRLGRAGGVEVIDDYAHHPTEIQATLSSVRAMHPEGRVVALFQPHLFSRTRDFADDFGRVLSSADRVWVTDVFPAREDPIPGVTGELVAAAARKRGGEARYHAALEGLADALAETLAAGDVLVVMGAGDVEEVAPAVLERLRDRNGASRDPGSSSDPASRRREGDRG